MSFIEFGNTGDSAADSVFVDNVRLYPSASQPGALATYDRSKLWIDAMTDANGHTGRFYRDGLGRVIASEGGTGRSVGVKSIAVQYAATPTSREVSALYPSANGHKTLGVSGARTVSGTPAGLEEGASLTTSGTVTVSSGQTKTMAASNRITLAAGFSAASGSRFTARIDAAAGGNQVSGTNVTHNLYYAGRRAIQMGASSSLSLGTASSGSAARTLFNRDGASGTPTVLSFDDGNTWCGSITTCRR